jgi:hypothetical protein
MCIHPPPHTQHWDLFSVGARADPRAIPRKAAAAGVQQAHHVRRSARPGARAEPGPRPLCQEIGPRGRRQQEALAPAPAAGLGLGGALSARPDAAKEVCVGERTNACNPFGKHPILSFHTDNAVFSPPQPSPREPAARIVAAQAAIENHFADGRFPALEILIKIQNQNFQNQKIRGFFTGSLRFQA